MIRQLQAAIRGQKPAWKSMIPSLEDIHLLAKGIYSS